MVSIHRISAVSISLFLEACGIPPWWILCYLSAPGGWSWRCIGRGYQTYARRGLCHYYCEFLPACKAWLIQAAITRRWPRAVKRHETNASRTFVTANMSPRSLPLRYYSLYEPCATTLRPACNSPLSATSRHGFILLDLLHQRIAHQSGPSRSQRNC